MPGRNQNIGWGLHRGSCDDSDMNNFAFNHSRLICSILVGIVAFWLLPAHWALVPRVLLSWNVGVTLFLAGLALEKVIFYKNPICIFALPDF